MLTDLGLDFRLFVESHNYDEYCQRWGKDKVIDVGGDDFGGAHHSRNCMIEYAIEHGHEYHWCMDDDINKLFRLHAGKVTRLENPIEAWEKAEDFLSRYTNLYMLGLSGHTFVKFSKKPYEVNRMAYGCYLLKSDMPYRFEDGVEDDLDMNLQILTTRRYCTAKLNIFAFDFVPHGSRAGGFTDLHDKGQRYARQKATLDKWHPIIPRIVKKGEGMTRLDTGGIWKKFTHPLIRHDGTLVI